ncbi:MAG: metallophosphoesterase [Desulfovibrionaceae bacterium]
MNGQDAGYWIAFGDVHERPENAGRIPGIREAAGVLISGDMTNRGGTGALSRVLDAVRAANPRVLAQIGNMDPEDLTARLERDGANLHLQVVNLNDGSEMPPVYAFGVGYSTPTPFGTPSEVQDTQLEQWLEETWARVPDDAHTIAVIHNPPVHTMCDRLASGAHVGSPAVRRFLEAAQPDLCITGHIHESRAEDRIGRTVIVNPGMLAQGGYVRIDLTPDGPAARLLTL